MKQLVSFISIFLLLVFGCRREQDYCVDTPAISYNYISKSSLELTQYFTNPKFDTISFSSSKGDTLVFIKTRTDSTWYDDKKYTGVPGCGPFEIQKNLEITKYYSTIKGDGIFKVKHSKETIIDLFYDSRSNIIEIYFQNNHFYFVENNFFDKYHPNYLGSYPSLDTVFSNVFYEYPNFNKAMGIKGYMAPGFGLIEIKDSLNSVTYTFNK